MNGRKNSVRKSAVDPAAFISRGEQYIQSEAPVQP